MEGNLLFKLQNKIKENSVHVVGKIIKKTLGLPGNYWEGKRKGHFPWND